MGRHQRRRRGHALRRTRPRRLACRWSGVFIDTILICTASAAIIAAGRSEGTGVGLVQNALTSRVGGWRQMLPRRRVVLPVDRRPTSYPRTCLALAGHNHPCRPPLTFSLIVLHGDVRRDRPAAPLRGNFADGRGLWRYQPRPPSCCSDLVVSWRRPYPPAAPPAGCPPDARACPRSAASSSGTGLSRPRPERRHPGRMPGVPGRRAAADRSDAPPRVPQPLPAEFGVVRLLEPPGSDAAALAARLVAGDYGKPFVPRMAACARCTSASATCRA